VLKECQYYILNILKEGGGIRTKIEAMRASEKDKRVEAISCVAKTC
jgi:hypothetical protein